MQTVKISHAKPRSFTDSRIGYDKAVERVADLAANVEMHGGRWSGKFRQMLEEGVSLPAMDRVREGGDPADALADFFGLCAGNTESGCDAKGYPGVAALAPRLARLLVESKSIGLDLCRARPCAADLTAGSCDLADLPKALAAAVARFGVSFEPTVLSLSGDHPDIRSFLTSCRDPAEPAPKLIVKLSDVFMECVRDRGSVSLTYHAPPARAKGKPKRVAEGVFEYGTLCARSLWNDLIERSVTSPQFAVVFAGLNRPASPLAYREICDAICPNLLATVPTESAVLHADIHLDRFVEPPGSINIRKLRWAVQTALRFADNLIDAIRWPLDGIKLDAIAHRRVALNLVGLGDAVQKMSLDPRRFQSLARLYGLMQFVRDCAYKSSVLLARERHAFPGLRTGDLFALMPRPELQQHVEAGIHKDSTRNASLIALSPYSVLPNHGADSCAAEYGNLLPLLRFADIVGFGGSETAVGMRPRDLAEFLRLTWAYARTMTWQART